MNDTLIMYALICVRIVDNRILNETEMKRINR